MNFLNSGHGYTLFQYEAQKMAYVDKSMMIQTVYYFAKRTNRYICVTRPRRFGKSTAANMLAAFFDPASLEKSKVLFQGLEIGELASQEKSCWTEQGKINVIHINMIHLITELTKTYQDFINTLNHRLLEDLQCAYPEKISGSLVLSIPDALEKTEDDFAFVIDEWDAIFEMPFMREQDRQDYILFLKGLLKDRKYVRFAYMTGILPIAKYSSGSPLNMFKEFTAFSDAVFYPYFGLTAEEIKRVMQREGLTAPPMEDLAFWYDGYIRGMDGEHVYNPTSVSEALAEGICQSHWTGTGPMNEVRDIIQHNIKDLREDIIRMAGGESLEIELSGFSAEKMQINTRDEILSAMVVYGFLTYHEKQLRIPNHELILKFREALSAESMGLRQTIEESKRLLRATLDQNHAEVARLIEELHDEKIPFFHYHDENSLACVIVTGYLAALDQYRIAREEKAGKGFVDFCFTPLKKGDLPLILELKYNRSAKNALQCIHERGYLARYPDYPAVLLVGINYSEKTKKHTCLTELVKQ